MISMIENALFSAPMTCWIAISIEYTMSAYVAPKKR